MRKPVVATVFVVSVLGAGVAGMHVFAPKIGAATPKAQILASTMPLSAGTLLRAQDVVWQGVAETETGEVVRPDATALATKPELDEQMRTSVYGAVLRHPLQVGEPIRRSDIAKPGDRDFLQVVLTPGARAIAIPVSTGGASTGLLQPGDRVDVILTQNFGKADNSNQNMAEQLRQTPLTRRSVGETVVENLRVLAVDAPDTKPAVGAAAVNPATGNFGRTVTLEVTADQAEDINVAAELGKLSLTLRSDTNTTLASAAAPAASPAQRTKPRWAGDVSPALTGALVEKPTALTPLPVYVIHGSAKTETIKSEY